MGMHVSNYVGGANELVINRSVMHAASQRLRAISIG